MDNYVQMVIKILLYIFVNLFINFALISDPLILISRRIKPYIEVARGIQDELKKPLHIEAIEDEPQDIFLYSPWIAIGKKALEYLSMYGKNEKIFFALVENTESIISQHSKICGIRIEQDPEKISRALKIVRNELNFKKIFIFITNQSPPHVWKVIGILEKRGIDVEKVMVSEVSQLNRKLGIIGENNALFILPDPSIINFATARFILRKSVKKHIVVIGYNRWFVQEGALIAIHIPYRKTGQLLGKMIKGGCNGKIIYPPSEITVNNVLGKRWNIGEEKLKRLEGTEVK